MTAHRSSDSILFLGSQESLVLQSLRHRSERVLQTTDRVTPDAITSLGVHWIVSFGYRHILSAATLSAVQGRCVNLHISLLPWNKGSDPNFWSILEDTPRGVTLHWMDPGIDTGDVIAQTEAKAITEEDTFATTYEALQRDANHLFCEVWPLIQSGEAPRWRQPPGGTFHRTKDKEPWMPLLTAGWETRALPFLGLARRVPPPLPSDKDVDAVAKSGEGTKASEPCAKELRSRSSAGDSTERKSEND